MKRTHRPDAVRRGVVAALGGAAVLFAARPAAAQNRAGETKLRTVEGEYRRLLPLWQEERKQFAVSSNTYDYW